MAIVALLSGKASPGVTTTAVALAAAWPGPVALVDADPAGGDIVPGWLSHWWVSGVIPRERGIVSFAAAARGLPVQALPAEALAGHVHVVPTARHVMVLPGVAHQAEAEALAAAGWQHLAAALRDLTHDGPDVIIDAGRIHPGGSPWPLIREADQVLVGVRGSLRHVTAAHTACRVLDEVLDRDHLGLAVCAGGDRRQIQDALGGLPVEVELPRDPSTASGFSDGGSTSSRPWRRSLLWRSAALAARRLRHRTRTATGGEDFPPTAGGTHLTTDPGTDQIPHDGKENPR